MQENKGLLFISIHSV